LDRLSTKSVRELVEFAVNAATPNASGLAACVADELTKAGEMKFSQAFGPGGSERIKQATAHACAELIPEPVLRTTARRVCEQRKQSQRFSANLDCGCVVNVLFTWLTRQQLVSLDNDAFVAVSGYLDACHKP
jgi:hypothetical protein